MTQKERKEALCQRHRPLLLLLYDYGNGAMLLAQLRALALALALYPSGQAVNRAVRALRDAGILDRQTWIDSNSDLILFRKFAYCFLLGMEREEVATPPRPKTMAPYIAQARKIDWLLRFIQQRGPVSLEGLGAGLIRAGCSVFLRLPDLYGYCRSNAAMREHDPNSHRHELEKLAESQERRQRAARQLPPIPTPAPAIPVVTMEQMHRRGIYIVSIQAQRKEIRLIAFPSRQATARRLMDWVIAAMWWLRGLFGSDYKVTLTLYTLDKQHKEALTAALMARKGELSYWRSRLYGERLNDSLQLAVHNDDFVDKWCGGVRITA